MKTLVTILIASVPAALSAQSVERQVIGSTGNTSTSSTVQVSSTVGETIVATATSATIILTQGFHQPGETSLGMDDPVSVLSIQAYPNPTLDQLTVELSAEDALTAELMLVNVAGQQTSVPAVSLEVSGQVRHVLNLSALAAGNYLLTISGPVGRIATIIVAKAN